MSRTLHIALAKYIEGLILTQGRRAGSSFVLEPWERRFLRGAFGQHGDAGLSLGRGNGKTTFCAAILAATLNGPLAQPGAESILVASSFDQGTIAYRHLLGFLRPEIEAHPKDWRVQDSVNRSQITYRPTGASARVSGSDPARMMGLAPTLILADELASWPPTKIDASLAALSTSRGKIPGSRMLWIGTRASSPAHPFELALNGGLGYSQVHAVDKDDNPFLRRTWRKANPGLRNLPDLMAVLVEEAAKAKRDPVGLQTFKSLRLNMGVPATVEDVLLSAGVWESVEVDGVDRSGPYVLGVDLSQNAAISALSAYWPESGSLDAIGALPASPGLSERGVRDGVGDRYVRMVERGELYQHGEHVVDVGLLLETGLNRWGKPGVIVADYWRLATLKQELASVDFPFTALVGRRNGPKDGGEDCTAFRNAVLDGHVHPVPSLLLRSCMGAARVTSDSGGNVFLTKKGRQKDDAAAASIIAVAEGMRRNRLTLAGPRYAIAG